MGTPRVEVTMNLMWEDAKTVRAYLGALKGSPNSLYHLFYALDEVLGEK
jgi:hypothetical protein